MDFEFETRWRQLLAALEARFGGGMDVYLTEKIGVSIMGTYMLPVTDLEDFAYAGAQFGLFYRF